MDDQVEILQESLDEVGNLTFSPPSMKKSDTRDSISSVDSDVSLSFDRRGSKGEEADLSDSSSSTDETDRGSPKLPGNQHLELIDNIELNKNQNSNITDTSHDTNLKCADTITLMPPASEAKIEEPSIICSDDMAEKIAAQVEFYFSDENIVKDAFLLKHVKRNKEGYVSLKLISSFKRVKHLSRDWRIVGTALRAKSTKLEVNELGTKLRRRDPLPQYDQTLPSRTVVAAKLPVEKLTIESVAELFRQCGEIALIRLLRPGHPVPAEVRQALAKRSELMSDEECAVIEFTDSAAARAAQKLDLGNAKIFELQQISSGEKKRKQQSSGQQHQQQSHPPKKSAGARLSATRENVYNSSGYPSGSEDDSRISRIKPRLYQGRRDICPSTNYHSYPGSPSPDTWLPRRFSTCAISVPENNPLLIRRLSSCSNSGFSSDTGSYSSRRFSSCSSSSDTSYSSPIFHPSHQGHHNLYPPFNCWPNQSGARRFSCCTPSASTPPNMNYEFEYSNANTSPYHQSGGRRASAECGPFLRRLSTCSRDSGFDNGGRRLSSCSSGSDSCSGFRSRSNSGFVVMAHLPENVTRLPSGPDGTRGFGRNNVTTGNSTLSTNAVIESSCG